LARKFTTTKRSCRSLRNCWRSNAAPLTRSGASRGCVPRPELGHEGAVQDKKPGGCNPRASFVRQLIERRLLRLLNDLGGVDLHGLPRLGAGIGFHGTDRHHGLQAGVVRRLAECRVLTVEMRNSSEAEEELRPRGMGIVGAGHREHTGLM